MKRSLHYSYHNRFRSSHHNKNQTIFCDRYLLKNRNNDNNKTTIFQQTKELVHHFSTKSTTTSGTANRAESTIIRNDEDIRIQTNTEDHHVKNSTSYDSASNWRRLAMMTTVDQQRINQMNDSSSVSVDINTTKNMTTISSSIPIERTRKDILYIVKQRVIERNSWTIHGVSQKEYGDGFPAFARLLKELIPKFLNFTIPCIKELDMKFPVLSMNWNIIQNYNNHINNNIKTSNNKQQQLHDGNNINKSDAINTTTTMINNNIDSSINSDNNTDNEMQVTWLGHSSLLVQMDQYNILADPIFSLRCSPFQWIGPKRYRPPPCTILQLMNNVRKQEQSSDHNTNNSSIDNRIIDVILISHNHYDHLDYLTIKEIVDYCTDNNISYPIFFVPLGLKVWFHKYISTEIIIYEMDWYETVNTIPPSSSNSDNAMLQVTCLPMRHWSNRGHDRDETLWCGYKVVTTSSSVAENNSASPLDQQKIDKMEHKNNNNKISEKKKRFLFSGDTAWFDEMKQIIGNQYGPYDVSAIPIGAYEPWNIMKSNHLNPYEAILMKSCINTKYAIPIHYGTFPLTTEPVYEPYELLQCYMKQKDDKSNTFIPWLIGETKQFPCM